MMSSSVPNVPRIPLTAGHVNPYLLLNSNPFGYGFPNQVLDNTNLQARLSAIAQTTQLLNYYASLPQNLPSLHNLSEMKVGDLSKVEDFDNKGMPYFDIKNSIPVENSVTINNLRVKAAKHAAALGL